MLETANRSDLTLAFKTAIGSTVRITRRGASSRTLEVSGTAATPPKFFRRSPAMAPSMKPRVVLNNFARSSAHAIARRCNPPGIVIGTDVALDANRAAAAGKNNVVSEIIFAKGTCAQARRNSPKGDAHENARNRIA